MSVSSPFIRLGAIFVILCVYTIGVTHGQIDPNQGLTFYMPLDTTDIGPHTLTCPAQDAFPAALTSYPAGVTTEPHTNYSQAATFSSNVPITLNFGAATAADVFFPRGPTNQFTVAAWVKLNSESNPCADQNFFGVSSLLQDDYSITLTLQTFVTINPPCMYQANWRMNTNVTENPNNQLNWRTPAGSGFDITNPTLVEVGEWHHVAAVWDGTAVRMIFDGEEILPAATASVPVVMRNLDQNNYTIGPVPPSNSINVSVDDVRFYDSALDASIVKAIMSVNRSLRLPTISVSNPSSLSLDFAPQDFNINATGTEPVGSPLSYYWEDRSGCRFTTFGGDNGATGAPVTLSIFNNGTVTLAGGASNGELCASETIMFSVAGSSPSFVEAPPSNASVYKDEYSEITIKAGGFPVPYISWQRLVTESFVLPNGTTATKTYFQTFPGQNGPTLKLYNGGGVFSLSNTSSNLTTRDDGETLTVQAVLIDANTRAETPSDTLLLTALTTVRPPPTPVPSTGDGDGGPNIPAIVVPVVVGTLLCCCCLCILLLLILLLLARGRGDGDSPYRIKLEEPDYVALAYGKMLEPHHSATKKQLPILQRLEQLVIESDYAIARAICENAKATEADGLAKVMTYIYAGNHLAIGLVQHFTTREVEASNKEGTLFRANSMASKMFTTFARIVASPYVWFIFARPVAELDAMAQQSEYDEESGMASHQGTLLGPVVMEVDPSKMEEAADDKVNTLQLWLVAQKLFSALEGSKDAVPTEIRQVLKHVNDEVSTKFNDQAAYKAMGGFLFLRLLCPSLMAPQVYGLLAEPPHAVSQRQLILLAKVMQNLANDTLPGKKEQYMSRLNEFITSNQDSLRAYYAALNRNAEGGPSSGEDVPQAVRTNAVVQLAHYIAQNRDRTLAQVGQEDSALADRLREIMDELGDVEVDEEL